MQAPAIEFDGKIIVESANIMMFLEEQYPEKRALLPLLPLDRYKARVAIEECSQKLALLFYNILIYQSRASELHPLLLQELRRIDAQLRFNSTTGPYWWGEQFTMVDIAYFPFIDR